MELAPLINIFNYHKHNKIATQKLSLNNIKSLNTISLQKSPFF